MQESRPDPDLLLAAIQKEDAKQKRGKLKVFFGMAAGVGKTYAMLEAAHKERKAGRDVVIGYLETHCRKETDRLAEGLATVPRKHVEYRGLALGELDLDAVLARRPQLALVDELAHTNAPGLRHPKRYQDILELLDAGIDVFTTLNVQHVESRADTVRDITGSTVQETVPDTVLDAAEIELVDLPPDELIKRLDEGKVYLPERAEAAMFNFFREGNLKALREMALRLAAERVGQDVRDYMQLMQIAGPWKSGHRLLVCVSPSPLSEQMVRWTRRLADSLNCPWEAVYVETSTPLADADQTRLTRHLALARELGAEVTTTTDEDIVRGLLRVAHQHNVSQIVIGKPGAARWLGWLKGRSLLDRLVRESGDIDVHIVRANKGQAANAPPWFRLPHEAEWRQYAAALGIVCAVGVLSGWLDPVLGQRTVALLFLLTVVGLALFVGRGPVFAAAASSALIWDYFFLPPRHTFYITSFEDATMFGMYFVVAIVLGQMTARIRAQEKAERRREARATALYQLTRELADAIGLDDIVRKLVEQVARVFEAEVAILLPDATGQLSGQPHPASNLPSITEKEQSIATWVFQHGQAAGRFTENLPLAEALYLPMTSTSGARGVMGVRLHQDSPPSLEQRNLLNTFARQGALVIDHQRLAEAAEQGRVNAESERLSKLLLNTISHELRTPIAAIGSAATSLAENPDCQKSEFQQTMLGEIQQATGRLNRLVGNLLDMTRLESGHVKPKLDWGDVTDLIQVAVKDTEKELARHTVEVNISPRLPLVRIDFVLMKQALANLLHNAAVHTPPGTAVQVGAARVDDSLLLTVVDNGPGLPPEAINRIFDKFYRAPHAPAGGTGLGLSIVKGLVEAQGGQVKAENRAGGGASFSILLPIEETPPVSPDTNQ